MDHLIEDPEEPDWFNRAVAAEDWGNALAHLPTPRGTGEHQLRFLLVHGAAIKPDEYGGLLFTAYKHAERGIDALTVEELRTLFEHPGAPLMGVRSGDGIEDLPARLTVFRGYHRTALRARFSWTTGEYEAAYFALLRHQSAGQPRILRGEVSREQVVTFLPHEREVIVDPSHVEVIEDYEVPPNLWIQCGYDPPGP